jgi:hypothetical protein
MVLGDIFTIVIAIIATNYKSLNLRQFSKILKILKLKIKSKYIMKQKKKF